MVAWNWKRTQYRWVTMLPSVEAVAAEQSAAACLGRLADL